MEEVNVRLSEQPEIKELFTVLQNNQLEKEMTEVKGLVDYIENMEEQIGQVMGELKHVNEQLVELNDASVKGTVGKIAAGVEHEIQQVKSQIQGARNGVVQFAARALAAGREKGIEGLKKVIKVMRVTPMLAQLKKGFHKAVTQMEKSASKVEAVRRELHAIGEHQRNIGRALGGKPMADPKETEKNKGVLVVVRNSYQSMGKMFQRMEQWTEKSAESLGKFQKSSNEKKSVKGELKKIKVDHSDKKMPVSLLHKEKGR